MLKRYYILVVTFVLLATSFNAQNDAPKLYFDKAGKNCSESVAYYYRQESDTAGYYRCFYVSNGKVYFKGKIKLADSDDDTKNLYTGECFWYHKNGNLKQARAFNDKGLEIGVSKYYYESGKIWKEIVFENGRVKNNTYTEFNEDGSKSDIFEDDFNNNYNDWDLYVSDKSIANITDGNFELVSLSNEGTSRYINHQLESSSYNIEAMINVNEFKERDKVGIIYGFKDWQNYHYFAISKRAIYIGSFFEGVKSTDVEAMYCNSINPKENNNIKILSTGDKDYFSVNGNIQYKDDANRLYGNNFGFILSGKTKAKIDRFAIKALHYPGSGGGSGSDDPQLAPSDKDVKVTGSGLIFTTSGYILTNQHVIANSNKFVVELNSPSGKLNYDAELIKEDKENDIAVLKIKDEKFSNLPSINYSFKENGALEVGGSVFTIGYPHALSGMGKEAKFTDGKISSKTGYNGSINSFQTSIPVQPGNSGGPVFNDAGQFIGLVNAKFAEADNVSYVIKLNYIKNVIELLSENITVPNSVAINTLNLEEKIKVLTNYVVLIKTK